MRRTFEETKESLEFMEKVDQLSPEQREHMRILVKRIVECYLDETAHGVIVISKDDETRATLLTVNCDEMEASVTRAKLELLFTELNMADAPPKEMMN
jgi:hypothetical protein